MTAQHPPPRFAVILPAFNEEDSIGQVLLELRNLPGSDHWVLAVGDNGSTDRTREMAEAAGALVARSELRGYGHGCQAAMRVVSEAYPSVEAWIFLAADGANDPRDIASLLLPYESGADMVLGTRTLRRENLRIMRLHHVLANRLLALWCSILSGRWFTDIGPLRIIRRSAFDALDLRELTYGWTIEAQILAIKKGMRVEEISVRERPRLAGKQKVSGVSLGKTLSVGWQILRAGWSAYRR